MAQSMDATTVNEKTLRLIDNLMIDYVHTIDDDELERWPDFFTEDASYKIITRENHEAELPLGIMYCDGRGMMQDRILALRTANIYEPHTYCHLLGRSKITVGEDSIAARTNFTVIRTMQNGDQIRFATGKYIDRIVEQGGDLKFQSRLVVLESRQIDILLVIPL